MENNVNNNVASNTNPAVSSGVVNNASVSANPAVTPAVAANVPPVEVNTVTQNVNPTVVNNEQNNGGNEQKNYKKFYIWMGVIVGLVLVVAGILLFFLLNGSIENRNRLTCTKTTQEDGYDYSIKRYYTFDNDVMVRVYYTYTFEYHNELTDDEYNQTFDEVINVDNNVGSTKYGLATSIQRKENVVEITSYEPNYYGEEFKEIRNNNKKEGYSCE